MHFEGAGKVIAVLGMHRSGTSCLIGSLQKAGLYLGKYNTWNAHNALGNRENSDIFELHEDLLAENGGSWKKPPREMLWAKKHMNWARKIIRSYAGQSMWGFKDPRMLLVLDGWKCLLNDLTFVGIYRHPAAVARSLEARGTGIGLSWDDTFPVYEYYNRLLLAEYEERPFPVLSFDWDETYFHYKTNALIQLLGLRVLTEAERFFMPELRHHRPVSHDGIPQSSVEIYEALNQICF